MLGNGQVSLLLHFWVYMCIKNQLLLRKIVDYHESDTRIALEGHDPGYDARN